MNNKKKYQSVMLVGNPGMVFRLSAFLMALASEKFNGSVNYCGFRQAVRWKKLYLRPLEWGIFIANLSLSDTILVGAACHHSNPGRLALRLGHWFKKKIIVDFYISHYETRVLDRALYCPKSKEAKRLWKFDREALEKADLALFLNNAEKEYYCRCLGLEPSSINSQILPITNDNQFKAAELPWHSGKAALPRFAWWGREVTNPIHGLDLLIRTFLEGKQIGELVLCLNTDEDKLKLYEKYPSLPQCPSIHCRADLNFADGSLPAFLTTEIDFAIGPLGDSGKSKVVVANKVIDAISLGLPLITQCSKGMRELLSDQVLRACFTYGEVFKNEEMEVNYSKVNVRKFQEACHHSYLETFAVKQFGHKVRSTVYSLSPY